MNFYVKVTAAVAFLIAAALAFIFLQSDPEADALEELVIEIIEKAKTGDVDACMKYVYKNYDHDGLDYEDIGRLADSYVKRQRYKKIELSGLEAEVHGDGGRARFTIHVTVDALGREIRRPGPRATSWGPGHWRSSARTRRERTPRDPAPR